MRAIPGIIIHHPAFTQAFIDARPGQKLVDEIRYEHVQGNGWSNIGYHYVLAKDTDGKFRAFDGRPDSSLGAHTYGYNEYLGICVAYGMGTQPPEAQLQALADLIAVLCKTYGIPIDRNHIKGHREFMPNECPGENLYRKLDYVVQLAKGSESTAKVPPQTKPIETSQEKHISSIDLQWGSGAQTQVLLVEDTSYMPITLLEKISADFGFPLDVGYVSAKDSKTGKPYVTIQRKK